MAIAPAITALILCILQVEAAPFVNVPVALKLQSSISLVKIPPYYITVPRGGAEDSDDDSSEDDSDSESEAEENGEEEEKYALDAKLVASTLKKNAQIKAKTSKEAVNVKLALPKKKKKMKLFRLPYIVRACLNPFTVMKMTVAYWKSLIDFNYGKEVSYYSIPVPVDMYGETLCRVYYVSDLTIFGIRFIYKITGRITRTSISLTNESKDSRRWRQQTARGEKAWRASQNTKRFAQTQYLRLVMQRLSV